MVLLFYISSINKIFRQVLKAMRESDSPRPAIFAMSNPTMNGSFSFYYQFYMQYNLIGVNIRVMSIIITINIVIVSIISFLNVSFILHFCMEQLNAQLLMHSNMRGRT